MTTFNLNKNYDDIILVNGISDNDSVNYYADFTKIIVAGSRTEITDSFYTYFESTILTWLEEHGYYDRIEKIDKNWQKDKKIIFISGGASSGADRAIIMFCDNYNLSYLLMPAQWDLYGKKAGLMRNTRMAEVASGNGALLAFWNGKSRGTSFMIKEASKPLYKLKVFTYMIYNLKDKDENNG